MTQAQCLNCKRNGDCIYVFRTVSLCESCGDVLSDILFNHTVDEIEAAMKKEKKSASSS